MLPIVATEGRRYIVDVPELSHNCKTRKGINFSDTLLAQVDNIFLYTTNKILDIFYVYAAKLVESGEV